MDGATAWCAGVIPFTADGTVETEPEAAVETTIRNLEQRLEQAGASLRDVVRVTYILPKADEFPQCWPVLRKHFGDVRPAATMLSAGLADPRMRIEIEVTARRRGES